MGGAAGLGVRLSSFLSAQFPWAFGAIHVMTTLNYLPPVLGYPDSDILQESRKDHVVKYSDFPPKLTLLSPLSRPARGTGHLVRRSAESPRLPSFPDTPQQQILLALASHSPGIGPPPTQHTSANATLWPGHPPSASTWPPTLVPGPCDGDI